MKKAQFALIKDFIIDQIEQGEWTCGDQVPSENQLADQFFVSRMTARRALTELVQIGILERSQGVGTFVSDLRPMGSMLEVNNIADEVAMRSQQYSCDVLTLESVSAKKMQAALLSLPEGNPVFHSVIVHKENGVPIQLEERYVNPCLAPGYDRQDFSKATPNSFLRDVAPLTEADHVVEAVNVNARIAALLAVAKNEPCLKITRRTFSKQGIVSLAYLIHPGSRYRLGGHLNF